MSGRAWLAAGVLLIGIIPAGQLMRPQRTPSPRSPLLAGVRLAPEVRNVLSRACTDCHSNETRWPWYARIAPVSLLIASDVERGRAFLNLSDWQHYSRGRRLGYLASMAEATRNQQMPPRAYSLLHADARLTAGERAVLAHWAQAEYREESGKRVRK